MILAQQTGGRPRRIQTAGTTIYCADCTRKIKANFEEGKHSQKTHRLYGVWGSGRVMLYILWHIPQRKKQRKDKRMLVRELFDSYEDQFYGVVIVSMFSTVCRSGIRIELKNPKIERTPVGIRLTKGDKIAEIDYRKIEDERSVIEGGDCSFKYKEAGLVMSVAIIPSCLIPVSKCS